MDKGRSSADSAGSIMKHPLIWGYWTQVDPDTIHIRDYAEEDEYDQLSAMCGEVTTPWDEPQTAQFILGNEKLCRACLSEYARNSGQVSKDECYEV